jgi:hypothetical protein
MAKKILIFSPEALLIPHISCNLVIGRTLKELGHTVRIAYCHTLGQRCVSKDSLSLPPGTPREQLSKTVCRKCSENFTALTTIYGLQPIDLRSFYPSTLYDQINGLVEPHRKDLVKITLNNIKFGYIAFHDVALAKKVSLDSEMDDETITLFQEIIVSSISLHIALSQLFQEEKFDMVIVNGQYAPNITALRTAAQFGIPGRILYNPSHMNIDRRWVEVCRTEGREVDFSLLDAWPEWQTIPLNPNFMAEVKRDIVVRCQGSGAHIYSPNRSIEAVDLRKDLNIPTDRKLLVAFTSSLDEQSAEHALFLGMERPTRPPVNELFADQVEWLRFIADEIGKRPDLYLMIRIHPREDSNKRDKGRSQHLKRLEAALAEIPPNVRVIWPRDPVSSYDLMELADVVLTSWSTAGLESARLGVPVLGAFRGLHNIPVGDFISAAETRDDYIRMIDVELNNSVEIGRILLSYRWYFVMRFAGAIWLGDVFRRHDQQNMPAFVMPSTAKELEMELFSGQPPLHDHRLNVRRALCADPALKARLEQEEMPALKSEMRDIVHFLFTGTLLNRPIQLEIRHVDNLTSPDPQPDGQALLLTSGEAMCAYRFAGQEPVHRYSPMAYRLARLCAQNQDPAGTDSGSGSESGNFPGAPASN